MSEAQANAPCSGPSRIDDHSTHIKDESIQVLSTLSVAPAPTQRQWRGAERLRQTHIAHKKVKNNSLNSERTTKRT